MPTEVFGYSNPKLFVKFVPDVAGNVSTLDGQIFYESYTIAILSTSRRDTA